MSDANLFVKSCDLVLLVEKKWFAIGGTSTVVLAADDPLSVVNNLSNFIFVLNIKIWW